LCAYIGQWQDIDKRGLARRRNRDRLGFNLRACPAAGFNALRQLIEVLAVYNLLLIRDGRLFFLSTVVRRMTS